MKKVILGFVCLVLFVSIFANKSIAQSENSSVQSSIEKKLIRFHVIANSDSAQDQALKLKVRDKVLEYIAPKLKNSKNIEESRNIIKQNNDTVIKIAEETVKKNGYNYGVTGKLSVENFPVKTYGNITLPQGEYEAYRIIIGSGKGQNWWCVMFPPLCFIDVSKGEVSYSETEKTMKQVLSEKEYEAVDNTKNQEDDNIIVKFRIVDFFNNLFKR